MKTYVLIFIIYYVAIVEILGCGFGEKMGGRFACMAGSLVNYVYSHF
jgi:hypothetical protein